MLTNRHAQHAGPGINRPERKPKPPESKENPLGTGISGNTYPAGEEEPQEASGGIVGHNRREEFNIQADAPQQLVLEIPRSNQISDEDR